MSQIRNLRGQVVLESLKPALELVADQRGFVRVAAFVDQFSNPPCPLFRLVHRLDVRTILHPCRIPCKAASCPKSAICNLISDFASVSPLPSPGELSPRRLEDPLTRRFDEPFVDRLKEPFAERLNERLPWPLHYPLVRRLEQRLPERLPCRFSGRLLWPLQRCFTWPTAEPSTVPSRWP